MRRAPSAAPAKHTQRVRRGRETTHSGRLTVYFATTSHLPNECLTGTTRLSLCFVPYGLLLVNILQRLEHTEPVLKLRHQIERLIRRGVLQRRQSLAQRRDPVHVAVVLCTGQRLISDMLTT